jgi:hypothetical protein
MPRCHEPQNSWRHCRLAPAISMTMTACPMIGMAGTSPDMTKRKLPRILLLPPQEIIRSVSQQISAAYGG